MKKLILVLILAFAFCLSGCGVMKVDPFISNSDPLFDLKLTTTDFLGYELTVTNKTKSDVEILWNKTQYIDESGTTNGFFMFGNEVWYEDQAKPKPASIIFANDRATKSIYPSSRAYWSNRSWRYNYLPAGKTGVYLTLRSNGEEIKHRLYVNISYSK